MDEITKEDNKKVKQAWRKLARKFAPKSRLGCKTCKTRRIKCDLSEPSCLKCKSTGRICDGYGETLPSLMIGTEPSSHYYNGMPNGEESRANEYKAKHWYMKQNDLVAQNLGPFMILPVTDPGQAEAMGFFEYISVKHLNEYRPSESWRNTLMYFSQTVPSVRYAAIALALVNQKYLYLYSGNRVHQRPSFQKGVPDQAALRYYNRAIKLILNQDNSDGDEKTAVTLLVCYLFICFDHLAGDYAQAMKHLRAGVNLSRNIYKGIPNKRKICEATKPSAAHDLIRQVTRQIRRLDMQAATFLVDWTPADIQEIGMSRHSGSAFQSLDQAADHLQVLVAQVMGLRNTEQQMPSAGKAPPPPSLIKNTVLAQLERWSSLFENRLPQSNIYEADSKTYSLISLLRLQYTIAWTYLSSWGPGREMEYDNFLTQFQQCVALAGYLAAEHERYSGSLKPTFTPEIGLVPVLYLIGAKCRHPVVRREALRLLRRQPIREAVWDSLVVARVIERVIEIEEGDSEEGEMTRSMEQIPVWQRVEALSWVHVTGGQSAGTADFHYTFCSREGMHSESLII